MPSFVGSQAYHHLWHSIHALFGNCDHKKRKKNKGQKPCFLAVKWYLDSSTEKKKVIEYTLYKKYIYLETLPCKGIYH